MRRMLQASLAVGLAFAANCGAADKQVNDERAHPHRRVLNAASQQPVAGAYVVLTWWGAPGEVAGARLFQRCRHAQFVVTDSKGSFQVPTWEGDYPTISEIYKPGMVRVLTGPRREGVEILRKSRAKGDGRYQEMLETSERLSCEGVVREFHPIHQALMDEALQIRPSGYVDEFEVARNRAKFGDQEADRLFAEKMRLRWRGGPK